MEYLCPVCGYTYDEASGIPNAGIPQGTRWERISGHFRCPWCGVPKVRFNPIQSTIYTTSKEENKTRTVAIDDVHFRENMHELSFGELSALCSGLAKSCERQYLFPEAKQFSILADYYQSRTPSPADASVEKLLALIEDDLSGAYVWAEDAAGAANDRGAKRILKWGKGVTQASRSILVRYQSQGDQLLQNTGIYICEICGHIEISDTMPRGCPVCRVSNLKIHKVE